jgi:P27 family predicted phage terminase small subunit
MTRNFNSGRRPLPTAFRLLTGNRGRRPLNHREPRPEITLPPPPDHLDSIGRQEWDRVAPELYELGVLSRLDVGVLAAMCAAHSQEVTFTHLVRKHGAVLYGPKRRPYPNPMLKLAAAARRDKVRFAIELGMTPSSRTRIDIGGLPKLDCAEGEADEFLD